MDPSDPLADTAAPRYAIESDEEEDEPNPLRPSTSAPTKAPEAKILGLDASSTAGKPLIIASGRAGAFWARGADLGEQQGGVYVDKIQVGLLFTPPSLSPSTVLISEPFTTLPLSSQHPYASFVLSSLKPSRVALLDTYSAPAYASEEGGVGLHDAPVRWISTGGDGEDGEGWKKRLDAKPFAPPNLLQSTTAAFLLSLYVSSLSSSTSTSPSSQPAPTPEASQSSTPATSAILLPSLQFPTPPPKTLLPTSVPHEGSADHEDAWSAGLMRSVSQSLLELVGQTAVEGVEWNVKEGEKGGVRPGARRSEVGEGGMYL